MAIQCPLRESPLFTVKSPVGCLGQPTGLFLLMRGWEGALSASQASAAKGRVAGRWLDDRDDCQLPDCVSSKLIFAGGGGCVILPAQKSPPMPGRKDATMVHYSLVIPHRDCAAALDRQIPRLCAELNRLALPYEIICVDDGSSEKTLAQLSQLLAAWPVMRLIGLDAAAGASTALAAGIAAARGAIVVAIEPGDHYSAEQIPHLIARLSRLDLVYARRRLSGWKKFWHRVERIPRWMLLGIEVRHPDCLFWAARREAVAGIQLPGGMRRYLPWLVARRGFRVGDMYVKENEARAPLQDSQPNPLDLLTAWWTCRRWRSDAAHEIHAPLASSSDSPLTKLAS